MPGREKTCPCSRESGTTDYLMPGGWETEDSAELSLPPAIGYRATLDDIIREVVVTPSAHKQKGKKKKRPFFKLEYPPSDKLKPVFYELQGPDAWPWTGLDTNPNLARTTAKGFSKYPVPTLKCTQC